MELNRNELLEAVKYCMIATTKDPSTLGSHCIAFTENSIISFNEVIGVKAYITTGIVGTYDATKLLKALNSFKGETINVTQTEKGITLKANKSQVSLQNHIVPTKDRFTHNYVTIEDAESFNVPVGFTTLLKEAVISEENKKTTGVFITGNDIISTNNSIIYHATFDGSLDPIRLSNKTSVLLDKFTPLSVKTVDTWALFVCDKVEVMVRQLPKDLYPVDRFIQGSNVFSNGVELCSCKYSEEILDTVKTAQSYVDYTKPLCTIQIDTGFTISAGSAESTYVNTVKTEVVLNSDTEFKVNVNPLLNLLKIKPDIISIRSANNRTVIIASNESAKYIIGVVE